MTSEDLVILEVRSDSVADEEIWFVLLGCGFDPVLVTYIRSHRPTLGLRFYFRLPHCELTVRDITPHTIYLAPPSGAVY